MNCYPIFLSVVCVVRNQSATLSSLATKVSAVAAACASDFEIIFVDNASVDDSIEQLRALTGEGGLPNLQVYALTKEVDADAASWVGLENALGDYVAVFDPMTDGIEFLPDMLERSVSGADVVFAGNVLKPAQSLPYRGAQTLFNLMYRWFNDVHLSRDAPQYRVLSKRVVNFILQHPQPALAYRHLPATGGFSKANLSYRATPGSTTKKKLFDSVDRSMRLLVSTTSAPMRLVSSLSLFGAVANVAYSIYVVAVGVFKDDVAPGWISLSLQQSGMFFLISLVLLVLGEYIINMASLSNEGPLYHVGQEFTSARMTRRERLNLEEVKSAGQPIAASLASGRKAA